MTIAQLAKPFDEFLSAAQRVLHATPVQPAPLIASSVAVERSLESIRRNAAKVSEAWKGEAAAAYLSVVDKPSRVQLTQPAEVADLIRHVQGAAITALANVTKIRNSFSVAVTQLSGSPAGNNDMARTLVNHLGTQAAGLAYRQIQIYRQVALADAAKIKTFSMKENVAKSGKSSTSVGSVKAATKPAYGPQPKEYSDAPASHTARLEAKWPSILQTAFNFTNRPWELWSAEADPSVHKSAGGIDHALWGHLKVSMADGDDTHLRLDGDIYAAAQPGPHGEKPVRTILEVFPVNEHGVRVSEGTTGSVGVTSGPKDGIPQGNGSVSGSTYTGYVPNQGEPMRHSEAGGSAYKPLNVTMEMTGLSDPRIEHIYNPKLKAVATFIYPNGVPVTVDFPINIDNIPRTGSAWYLRQGPVAQPLF